MLKKEKKLVYFDLDGTLLNSQKEITSASLKGIDKLRANNWKVGIATGRPPYMIKKEHSIVKPDLPVITANGALVTNRFLDMESPLEMTLLNKEIASKVFYFLLDMKVTFLINSSKCHYFIEETENNSYWVNWLRETIKNRDHNQKWDLKKIEKDFDIDKINVLKFLIVPDQKSTRDLSELKEFLQEIQNSLKDKTDLTWLPSQKHVLDIFNGRVSKGSYLTKMGQDKKIDLNKLTVFGDALNDASLFKVAKVSVAMGNANEKLKEIATYTTKSNNDEGIAYFIAKRLLNEH